jgi:hypothetical protein
MCHIITIESISTSIISGFSKITLLVIMYTFMLKKLTVLTVNIIITITNINSFNHFSLLIILDLFFQNTYILIQLLTQVNIKEIIVTVRRSIS